MTVRRKSRSPRQARAEGKPRRPQSAGEPSNKRKLLAHFLREFSVVYSHEAFPVKDSVEGDWHGEHVRLDRVGPNAIATHDVDHVFRGLIVDTVPPDGAYWVRPMIELAPTALLDSIARLVEIGDLAATGTNTVSAIGDLVSAAVRREMLRFALRKTEFHLGRTAQMLRVTSGPALVARMIRDLGLTEEYEQGRAKFGAARGGRPKKGTVAG